MRKVVALRRAGAAARTVPPPQPELPTLADRLARRKALRATVSRKAHVGWEPPRGRRDPIEVRMDA